MGLAQLDIVFDLVFYTISKDSGCKELWHDDGGRNSKSVVLKLTYSNSF